MDQSATTILLTPRGSRCGARRSTRLQPHSKAPLTPLMHVFAIKGEKRLLKIQNEYFWILASVALFLSL